jgi:hypothetical protein
MSNITDKGLQEGSYYYDLFKFFSDNHNLTLTDTEINDIIAAVNQFQIQHQQSEELQQAADK